MATHKSAEKRARQALRKNAINRKIRSTVVTAERKIRNLIAKKDKKAAEDALPSFMSALGKAAQKGAFHKSACARRIARVSSAVAALK